MASNIDSARFVQKDSVMVIPRVLALAALSFAFVSQIGCSHIIKRAQSPEAEGMEFNDDLEATVYIGDVAGPTDLNKLKVTGVALVTQLDGTGSEPAPSWQRDRLVEEIKRHQVEGITDLLASKNNSLVVVSGDVPPGARKGDRFDIVVKTVGKSRTSSLEGGFLMQSRLKPYVETGSRIKSGHNAGNARGRVVIDKFFESGDQPTLLLGGIVPGGGVVTRDRECGIQIVGTERSIKKAALIARAINSRFSARVQGRPEGVANPLSDEHIELLIPEDYRHNIGRYFHVIMNMTFDETADRRVNRMERLERDLHNPEKSKITSIRLEAIGDDAKSILKRGLRSSDLMVQFQSAQALAYMLDESGVQVLAKAAASEPAFRWHALTALASLKNSASEDALKSLFNNESAEARYGAFRALRESMPESIAVDGDFVGREFMLHTVASSAKPMVHLSRTRIPEVVLFGGDQKFNKQLLFFQAGLTVKWDSPSRIMIKRYLPDGQEQKIVCTTLVSDVIRQMVKLGANYGDVVRLLKDARQTEAMDSRLVINAIPLLNTNYQNQTMLGEASEKYVTESMPGMFDDSAPEPEESGSESEGKKKGIFRSFW